MQHGIYSVRHLSDNTLQKIDNITNLKTIFMKQKLLFLMAFLLLGVTAAIAQTTIDAVNMSATYGDAPKNIGATFTSSETGVTLKYITTNSAIADVDAAGLVTFKASTRNEAVSITIQAVKGSPATVLSEKTISVVIAQKNIKLTKTDPAVTNKPYDGTTTASLIQTAFGLDPADLVAGDATPLNVELNFTGMSANFDTKEVGTNKTVTLNQAFTLQGSRAFCYTLTSATSNPTLKGNITIGSQPSQFGLNASYSNPISDLKLDLVPNVKEAVLKYQVMSNPGIANISVAADNKITVNFIGTGTTNVRFYTDATTNYNAAEVTISFTINPPTADNDIVFPAVATFIYGDVGKTMAVTGVKDNATVTYTSSNTDVATINSATGALTILKAGLTTITAKSSQTINYKETSKTANVTVNKKDIAIAGVTVTTKTYDATSAATLNWTAASLATLVSGDNDKVSINNSGITSASFDNANAGTNKNVTATGTATLGAGTNGDQSGNYNLTNGNLANLNLRGTINKASQPANLSMLNAKTVYVGEIVALGYTTNGTPTITPSSNPATGVTYPTTGQISFANAGNYTVSVSTSNDGNYNDATGTTTYTVLAANNVSFQNTAAQTVEYGTTQPLGVTAAYSGGAITTGITYTSSNVNVVTVNPTTGVIQIIAASGVANITVAVAASGTLYNAASTIVQITATPRKLTISGITISNKVYDGTTTAQATGTMAIGNRAVGDGPAEVSIATQPTFSFADKNVGTAKTINATGGSLTGTKAAYYVYSGGGLSANITKANQLPNLGLNNSLTLRYGEAYTFVPSVYESTTFDVTYASSNQSVAKFADATRGNLSLIGTGTTNITITATAKDPATCNYNNMTATVVLQVVKGTQVITAPSVVNALLSDGAFPLTPSALNNPTFTYEATNNDAGIISVNASTGVVTPLRAGTAKVLITALETGLYNEKKQSVDIVVTEGVAITTQPQPQNICVGNPFTLSVGATGATSFQWYRGGAAITGATGASYSVATATINDAGSYYVVARGANGSTATSNTVAVTIGSGVTIITQPVAQTVCVGGSASFSVLASGTGLSYQWQKNGANITNATQFRFDDGDVQASDTASYRVVVTGNNTCGGTASVTSSSVRLDMVPPIPANPAFYSVPAYLVKKDANITIIVGDRTKGYEGVTKYTWNYSTDASAFTDRETTVNTNVLHVTPFTVDGTLTVTMSHPCGNASLSKFLKAVPTGIDNVTAAGMKIYPNPVTSGSPMTIDLGDGNTGATIYVYNVTGSLLMNANLTSQVSTIPTTLKPGIYMMKIAVPNGKTAHHKFIVK